MCTACQCPFPLHAGAHTQTTTVHFPFTQTSHTDAYTSLAQQIRHFASRSIMLIYSSLVIKAQPATLNRYAILIDDQVFCGFVTSLPTLTCMFFKACLEIAKRDLMFKERGLIPF